jgi:UDP-N-acetyl-D-galactosamine dehydrogenase
MDYSLNVHIVDPYASPNEVAHEFKLPLMDEPSKNYDAIIVAVGHQDYLKLDMDYFNTILNGTPILFDLKGIYKEKELKADLWRL